jgi:hypothetical protein
MRKWFRNSELRWGAVRRAPGILWFFEKETAPIREGVGFYEGRVAGIVVRRERNVELVGMVGKGMDRI